MHPVGRFFVKKAVGHAVLPKVGSSSQKCIDFRITILAMSRISK